MRILQNARGIGTPQSLSSVSVFSPIQPPEQHPKETEEGEG